MLRSFSWGSTLFTAALLAGCGGSTAATVNVEGTVQARVAATVSASTHVQASPTRQSLGTIIAIPAAGTAIASPSAADTALATPASTASVSPNTTEPSLVAAATRQAPTIAASTAPPSSGVIASPSRARTEALRLGTHTRLGGLWVTVSRYEWSFTCPSGGGPPAPGFKYVVLHLAGRNDAIEPLTVPAFQWTVGGHLPSSGGQVPCRPEGQSFAEACPRTLPAGARCEGWLLFEVPEAMEVPGAIIQATSIGGVPDTARWRLPA
ncbi:MAG TPA: hypothetical protein VGW38_07370 [Chloroflexota bacterium]|nr:hypothetical protein [Chloroflexota bacterium]